MINIIRKLFQENNFKVSTLEQKLIFHDSQILHNSFFAKNMKPEKIDNFLVIELKDQSINDKALQDMLDDYFGYLIIENSQQGIDKNISLLILIEEDSVKLNKEFNLFVYDIEEDPYDFKKYVLPYTKSQLFLLKQKTTNENSYTDLFQKILSNKDLFLKFKKHTNDEEVLLYDIVAKIFIKLHFLTLQINTLSLSNLEKEIESQLSQKQIAIKDKVIAVESVDKLNIDELLEKLGVVDKIE